MHGIEKVFGKCTGVKFNIFGESKGVVIFYARGTAEERIINSPVKSNFLRLASNNIGSALAMLYARARNEMSRKYLGYFIFQGC